MGFKYIAAIFLFVCSNALAICSGLLGGGISVLGTIVIDGKEHAYAVLGGFREDAPGLILQTAKAGVAFADTVYAAKGTIAEHDNHAHTAFHVEPFFDGKSAIVVVAERTGPTDTLELFNSHARAVATIGVSFAKDGLPFYNRLKEFLPPVFLSGESIKAEFKKFATAEGIKIRIVPIIAGLLKKYVFESGMGQYLGGGGHLDEWIYVEAPSGTAHGKKRFMQPRRYRALGFENVAILDKDHAFEDGRGVAVMRIAISQFNSLAPPPEEWRKMEIQCQKD